jgi:cell wall-associated NlpC family hydrolase
LGDWTLRLGTGVVAAVLLLLLVVQGAAVILFSGGGNPLAGCDVTDLATGADSPDLTGEQIVNATTILTVAQHQQLPPRAAVIAVASALQESRLRNLNHGDRDSLGLFQQRPSQGWGDTPTGPGDHRTPAQRITDPTYAATTFYSRLTTIHGWQDMAVTVAAQAVQNSGHPDAYADWEPLAARTVAALSAQTCLDDVSLVGSPTAAAGTAIAYARAQLGLPYEWAGDGPEAGDLGFDCSGLTHAAYEAAGITIPRTAQTQYNAGPRLSPGQGPEPGDLVFYGTSPIHVSHVGLVVAPGYMIDAPHTGARIRLERLWTSELIGYSRPRT